MRLLRDDLGRLARRPATWVSFALVAGLLVFVFVVVGASAQTLPSVQSSRAIVAMLTFPAAYDAVLSFLIGLGQLLALIYGAALAGSEWTWGTLKNAVARGESRARYAIALFAAIAVVLGVGLLLAMAIGVGGALVGAAFAGISTSGLADASALAALPEKLVRAWLGIVESAAIGFAIANVTRSQLAGIAAGVATYFGEQFSTLFFPDIVKFLPFHVAEAVVNVRPPTGGETAPPGFEAHLPADVALVVLGLWLVGALLVSAVATERADITG
jgi:ABC-2 type transport system permease protein